MKDLFPEERKRFILDQLKLKQKVQVTSLAEQFSVTSETIRRDLDQLEKDSLIKRVYGGAVLSSYQHGEPSLNNRKSILEQEKKLIGKKAAEFIKDGTTLVIDIGTTMLELARHIKNKENVTILTNSLPVSSILLDSLNRHEFSGQVILLGGELNIKQHSITGKITEMVLENFIIDQAFISAGGMSLQNGISDYDLSESMISKSMIKASKEIFVLADHSKIGVDAFCKICRLDEVDAIVCNNLLPQAWHGHEGLRNVDWIVANE